MPDHVMEMADELKSTVEIWPVDTGRGPGANPLAGDARFAGGKSVGPRSGQARLRRDRRTELMVKF